MLGITGCPTPTPQVIYVPVPVLATPTVTNARLCGPEYDPSNWTYANNADPGYWDWHGGQAAWEEFRKTEDANYHAECDAPFPCQVYGPNEDPANGQYPPCP